ncbi:hypothetical protein ScPMuIL_017716 [Solemya velum]
MAGCCQTGVRFLIAQHKDPSTQTTTATCRFVKTEKLLHPPYLNEGEALATHILEMEPAQTKFMGRILIEVSHIAPISQEREIVILRGDGSETWCEHPITATEKAVNDALGGYIQEFTHDVELEAKHIVRILTSDFPKYFALVTRICQNSQEIGVEGGFINSSRVPQAQAVFPKGCLIKPIKVGLQAHRMNTEIVAKVLGGQATMSPVVTVEPRRRKFHKAMTLMIPIPKAAAEKGKKTQHDWGASTLRILSSISGGKSKAVWDDLTDCKPLTFVGECPAFTTTVSARFCVMDCPNGKNPVPLMTQMKNLWRNRSIFVEVAKSRNVEVCEDSSQYVEISGNLIPATGSGDQLSVNFQAFRENQLVCTVHIQDLTLEPAGQVAFMQKPITQGVISQIPICKLDVTIPDISKISSAEIENIEASDVQNSLLTCQGQVVIATSEHQIQMNIYLMPDSVQLR